MDAEIVQFQETGIQSQVVSYKNSKIVLDASFLNTQHYKVRIKDKWSNPRKGVSPSATPRSSSY